MLRFLKGVCLATLIAVLALTASGCQYLLMLPAAMLLGGTRDCLSREEIGNLVSANRELLLQDIASDSFVRSRGLEGIQEIHVRRDDGYVEYYCGGWGIVPESGYVGFYYSFDGRVNDYGYMCLEEMERTEMDGGLMYRMPDGDNYYFTAPLGDGFWYYESHY